MSPNDVREQIQELEKLKRQTRRLSLGTLVGMVAILVAGVGAILSSFHSLTVSGPKQREFLRHLGGNMQSQVLPAAQRMAEPSLKRLKPSVEAELKRLDAQAPRLSEAALRELSKLGPNLAQQAEVALDQTVGQTLAIREQKLRKMYPAATDKNIAALMANLHRETQQQIVHTADQVFLPHLDCIHHILANLEKIQQNEPVGAGPELNSWQVAFLFVDVFTEEFKDLALGSGPQPR
jgi:hypothetical protein